MADHEIKIEIDDSGPPGPSGGTAIPREAPVGTSMPPMSQVVGPTAALEERDFRREQTENLRAIRETWRVNHKISFVLEALLRFMSSGLSDKLFGRSRDEPFMRPSEDMQRAQKSLFDRDEPENLYDIKPLSGWRSIEEGQRPLKGLISEGLNPTPEGSLFNTAPFTGPAPTPQEADARTNQLYQEAMQRKAREQAALADQQRQDQTRSVEASDGVSPSSGDPAAAAEIAANAAGSGGGTIDAGPLGALNLENVAKAAFPITAAITIGTMIQAALKDMADRAFAFRESLVRIADPQQTPRSSVDARANYLETTGSFFEGVGMFGDAFASDMKGIANEQRGLIGAMEGAVALYGQYSPDIAMAQGTNQMQMFEQQFDTAQDLGPDLARYEKSRGEGERHLQRISSTMTRFLLPLTTQMSETFNEAFSLVADIFEIISVIFNTILKPLMNSALGILKTLEYLLWFVKMYFRIVHGMFKPASSTTISTYMADFFLVGRRHKGRSTPGSRPTDDLSGGPFD